MKYNFWQRAANLGHDLKKLEADEEVWMQHIAKDIDELRKIVLLGHDNKFPKKDEDPPDSIVERAFNFVFFGVPLSDADRLAIAPSFPMKFLSYSSAKKHLGENEIFQIGTSKESTLINCELMTLEAGSAIAIENSGLVMYVDEIVINSNVDAPGSPGYHLGIFGRPGITPNAPNEGAMGEPGTDGSSGTCIGGGGVPGNGGATGGLACKGGTGECGEKGGDGFPSLNANININKISGAVGVFVIASKTGDGGQGGPGAKGGRGGTGGKGGDAVSCGCTCTTAGIGGEGGRGGTGGPGGPGGNCVSGNDIFVSVPKSEMHKVERRYLRANPGEGGLPGPGGDGGSGGNGGASNVNGSCPTATPGLRGTNGQPGDPGLHGIRGGGDGSAGVIWIDEMTID